MAKKKKQNKTIIYQQFNLKTKLRKQEEQTTMDTENVVMVARWEGGRGQWVKR